MTKSITPCSRNMQSLNINLFTTQHNIYKRQSQHLMRMGRPLAGMGIGSTTIFSSGSNFSHLYLFTTLCMNTSISNRAYSFPGHILGPPPNGTNVYGAGPVPSNLLGSNFSGSRK
ncbi:hypothetical protein RJ641_025737 [Dillenia turbinata]|uniref:Uncharacterized protein n=1 Tax=Dillenia turbinata TaxID=194707 RepID=A0AAN8W3H4_9MAGN